MDPTVNWPVMRLPVEAMKTYGLSAPQATHYRPASCREVDCPNYANGWRSSFDVTDPERARAAYIVRMHSGRLFTVQELTGERGTVERVVFTFAPGQECFLPHRVPLEREPVLYVRGGDFRGNPYGDSRVHVRTEDWVDDFGEHQLKIRDRVERG